MNDAVASPAHPPPDERHLVSALRSGDEAAFEILVKDHGARLLAVARRLLRAEEDARDAVQDAFLAAFRSIGQFHETSRLSTWLHRIVVNSCLMKMRTRRRRPEDPIEDFLPRFQDDGHQVRPSVAWESPSDVLLERSEIRALVRRSIDRLPEGYRTVLVLRDLEELDTRETARVLETTETAVKVRLHRARQALRELLDPFLRGMETVP